MSDPQPPRPPLPPTEPTRPLHAPVPPPTRAPVAALPVERLAPELPPPETWWGNPWPAILTGILGLIIGAVLGYALSGGKGETVTEAQRAGSPAVTQTVTNTTTVPKVVVHNNTVTSNTVTQAPANAANEERRVEAETRLRKAERENEELKRQQGEG